MIIVSGHLVVDPSRREAYLETCREVVEAARATSGCEDFALSGDLVDPGRINILERWSDAAALAEFRGDGVEDEQASMILDAHVVEHVVPG